MAITPAELATLKAAPLVAASWQQVRDMTPNQLSQILAALATAGQTAHIQTGGTHATATYLFGDGGSVAVPTGTDSAGTIAVTSGAGGGSGDIANVSFSSSFTAAPVVILLPLDAASAALSPFPDGINTGGFNISVGAVGVAVTYNFAWIAVGAPK